MCLECPNGVHPLGSGLGGELGADPDGTETGRAGSVIPSMVTYATSIGRIREHLPQPVSPYTNNHEIFLQ